MSIVDWLNVAIPHRNRSEVCNALVRRDLIQPAEQFLERSGKRIRKSVVELVFAMAGGTGPLPSCLAEAIEWLHAGSLVIDDIQDDSPIRRGQPSLHMQIGVPLGLNAGNWMYFQALERLFDDSLNRTIQNRLVHHLVRTASRCHRGQSLDLGTRVDLIAAVDYHHIHTIVAEISRLKTGSLVSMAASFGAVAAGAARPLREALSRFGMHIGIALQMRNDLEELRSMTNDSKEFRTMRTDDLRNARITWPWAWASADCTSDEFAALVRQLPETGEDPLALSRLATQLLSHTVRMGEDSIRKRLNRSYRQLAAHKVDKRALEEMGQVLDRISRSGRNTKEDSHAKLA